MASYKNYQSADKKNSGMISDSKRRQSRNKNLDNMSKKDRFVEGLGIWLSYFRTNPHRFVIEFLQLKPFSTFQMILLFMMFQSDYFLWWASRGLGKSYLTALYCVVRCILYPGTKVCIASGTKGQAQKIVTEKIQEFYNTCPMVRREIERISPSLNDCGVDFHNGSWIKVVAARDSGRSARANVVIIDEFRMVDLEVINKVLRKFLTSRRMPGFISKMSVEEGEKYREPNTEIYLSSAWYKDHWSWAKFLAFKDMMLKTSRYFTCGFPYQMAVKYGVIDKQRIMDEMEEGDFDPISFEMEMGCLPQGESENAYFKFDQLNRHRKIKMPIIPPSNEEYLKINGDFTKLKFFSKKMPGEIRMLGMDVALMGSKNGENDASSITFIRCFQEGKHYKKSIEYLENIEGQHTDLQALRLKQLFYDLNCDYVVLDTHGNGLSIYDQLVKVTQDEFRGKTYPAWTAFNDEDMAIRALDKNALPVIYSMKVAGANATFINHDMATYVKNQFISGNISLLANEIEAKDHLEKIKGFDKLSQDEKMEAYLPFINTSRMISEMIKLERGMTGNFLKLKEKSNNRKDRYSSLAYTLYFIKELEQELVDEDLTEYDYYNQYMFL